MVESFIKNKYNDRIIYNDDNLIKVKFSYDEPVNNFIKEVSREIYRAGVDIENESNYRVVNVYPVTDDVDKHINKFEPLRKYLCPERDIAVRMYNNYRGDYDHSLAIE